MVKLQKYNPPVKPPHGPAELNDMTDPEAKALAAIKVDDYASRLGKEARRLRDQGICGMRDEGLSMPKIATRLGLSVGTVKTACR